VNLLRLAGAGILGLASLLVLGSARGGHLFGLSSNRRFRDIVGSRPPPGRPRRPPESLVGELSGQERSRLMDLNAKLERILGLYDRFHSDDLTSGQNRESLLALLGHYARLLLARENLALHWTDDDDGELRGQAGALEAELKEADLSPELRTSKLRTLEIVQARVENQRRLAQMGENRASCAHQAQFDLALRGRDSSAPQAISSVGVGWRADAALASLPREHGVAVQGRASLPPPGQELSRERGSAPAWARSGSAATGAAAVRAAGTSTIAYRPGRRGQLGSLRDFLLKCSSPRSASCWGTTARHRVEPRRTFSAWPALQQLETCRAAALPRSNGALARYAPAGATQRACAGSPSPRRPPVDRLPQRRSRYDRARSCCCCSGRTTPDAGARSRRSSSSRTSTTCR
jgi:hypothetical protein